MTKLTEIKEEFEHELSNAKSNMESNMIRAEYNFRIKKLVTEGTEAYELAYVFPNQMKDIECACKKD